MQDNQPRSLSAPNQNVAQQTVIIVQSATTMVKEAIIKGEDVEKIITEFAKKIEDIKLRGEVYNALKLSARKWEYEIKTSIAVMSIGRLNTSKLGFRGFLDNARQGIPVIQDYQSLVKLSIKALSSEPPKIIQMKNGKAYTMSIRNRAEMAVRYETNLKEVQEFMANGVEYVWATSHANASPRCKNHQGKLYSLNANNKSGSVDGIRYTYLLDVLALNDGNSIINGYNCRHRLVEYFRGSKPPNDYSEREIKREYALDQKQRRFENNIRQMKTEERLLRATGDPALLKEAQALRLKWRRLSRQYEVFSFENERPFYRWRTQITEDESSSTSALPVEEKIIQVEKEITDEQIKDSIIKTFGNNDKVLKALTSIVKTKENKKIISNLNKLGNIGFETSRTTPNYQPSKQKLEVNVKSDNGTYFHELGHAVDHLYAKKYAKEGEIFKWVSHQLEDELKEERKSLKGYIPSNIISVFAKETKKIKEKLEGLVDVKSIAEKAVFQAKQKFPEKKYGTMVNYLIQQESSKIIKNTVNKLATKLMENDEEHKKWACLSDVYDAITYGSAINSRQLIAKHGSNYYSGMVRLVGTQVGDGKKENGEVFANFVEMKLGGYAEQLTLFEETSPKLFNKLNTIYNDIANDMEKLNE